MFGFGVLFQFQSRIDCWGGWKTVGMDVVIVIVEVVVGVPVDVGG